LILEGKEILTEKLNKLLDADVTVYMDDIENKHKNG